MTTESLDRFVHCILQQIISWFELDYKFLIPVLRRRLIGHGTKQLKGL